MISKKGPDVDMTGLQCNTSVDGKYSKGINIINNENKRKPRINIHCYVLTS